MRLALETRERLGGWVQGLEFVPCATPPHKDGSRLLPFELRVAMIRETVDQFPGFSCNEVEGQRSGPSYTWETLTGLGRPEELYFLLGSQDFALLPQWYRGLELPLVANIVVVPRGGHRGDDFLKLCMEFFGAEKLYHDDRHTLAPGSMTLRHGEGCKIIWLPEPYLDVSASYVRQCWLAGRDITYLVPPQTMDLLNRESRLARACWVGKDASCST